MCSTYVLTYCLLPVFFLLVFLILIFLVALVG